MFVWSLSTIIPPVNQEAEIPPTLITSFAGLRVE